MFCSEMSGQVPNPSKQFQLSTDWENISLTTFIYIYIGFQLINGNCFDWFGRNFCSEMSSQVPNLSKQNYVGKDWDDQSLTATIFVYKYCWAMENFEIIASIWHEIAIFFHWFGCNFFSDMSSQVPNPSKKFLVLMAKINDWLIFFCIQRYLSYGEFWHYSPNLKYVAKLQFFHWFYVTSDLWWVHRYQTHQNNVCLVLIKNINQ